MGFEPTTLRDLVGCSNHLSYWNFMFPKLVDCRYCNKEWGTMGLYSDK